MLSGSELYPRWVPLRITAFPLCNLVGRTHLMVALKSNNHCISALCNRLGRTYLMITLKSNYSFKIFPRF